MLTPQHPIQSARGLSLLGPGSQRSAISCAQHQPDRRLPQTQAALRCLDVLLQTQPPLSGVPHCAELAALLRQLHGTDLRSPAVRISLPPDAATPRLSCDAAASHAPCWSCSSSQHV